VRAEGVMGMPGSSETTIELIDYRAGNGYKQ